jgi:ketosteroid isomerase-like protein
VLLSPSGQWRGHAALRAAAEAFFATVTAVQITITRVLLDGDQGAVEWTWTETRRVDGQIYTAEDAIIFVLRDGRIIFWREYVDTTASIAGEHPL